MKINYKQLSTKDLAALAQRVVEEAKQSEINEVKNHLFLTKLETSYQQYYEVISKQAFSGKGQTVSQADKLRDVVFRQLKKFLEGYSQLPSAPNNADAVALFQEFKLYGLKLDKLSYAEQTVQQGKLIEALSSEKNQAHLQKLGIETAFNELKSTYQDFKVVFDQQAQANSELRNSKSATDLRKEVEKDLRRFLELVTLMFDTEQWKSLYAKLNEFVKAAKK